MKTISYLIIPFLFLSLTTSAAQKESNEKTFKSYPVRKLTIEPAIGLNPYPMSDLVISNLFQYNIKKRLSVTMHSSYTYNNAFLREFNHVRTNYNYSLGQKFGIGTSIYAKRSSHTFSLMAGIKYDAFKETFDHPEFESVSASVSSLSPDFGIMYNLKIGVKKMYFSYRMYIPLYPYPFLTSDSYAVDANLANVSMEFGVGIRLK